MSLHARFGGGGGCGSGGRLDRAPPAQIVRTKRVRACIFRRVGETRSSGRRAGHSLLDLLRVGSTWIRAGVPDAGVLGRKGTECGAQACA